MKRWPLLLLGLLCATSVRALDVLPLESGDYARLIKNAKKPALVAFWSVDCTTCHRELPQLLHLQRIGRIASLILISTDEPDKAPELASLLKENGFSKNLTARVFGKTDPARLRHEIDPKWTGETPRHYLHTTHHPPAAWSGPLSHGPFATSGRP